MMGQLPLHTDSIGVADGKVQKVQQEIGRVSYSTVT
jgi:hypothetical protein